MGYVLSVIIEKILVYNSHVNCSIEGAMSKLFGTDGIRGIANEYPVTPDLCVKLAMAAGREFISKHAKNPRVIIAKDTRLSGYLIEYALTAGFISVGMEVILVGPMPTPAVSMLVRSMRADCGVMVSASHNPYMYNGIKFFNKDGEKISSQTEEKIESNLVSIKSNWDVKSLTGEVGRTYRLDDAQGRYIEFLKTTFDKKINLNGLKIVIDAANGSAYKIAPTILWELGAEVITVAANPDGYNINAKCGATYPRNIATEVLKHEADLGIALDGDADRVIMCDEHGQIIDGDRIIALLANEMKQIGKLTSNSIVVTEMSNCAMDKYLNSIDIKVYRTNVGDKFVYEKMIETKSNMGGESSGHIILREYNKTGDGMVAALNVLECLIKSGKRLSYVSEMYMPFPRIIENIQISNKEVIAEKGIQHFITNTNKKLGNCGRLFVRPSGTEPVIRILAEGEDEKELKTITSELTELIQKTENSIKNKQEDIELDKEKNSIETEHSAVIAEDKTLTKSEKLKLQKHY